MKSFFVHQKEAGETMHIYNPSSFKKMLLLPLFALFALSIGTAQVVISEVFPNGTFELENNGNATVDVSSYWICTFPSYTQLSDLSVECGDLSLEAGASVTLSGFNSYDITDDELGLYNARSFSSSTAIVAYVDWGQTTNQRASVAVQAGIWTQGDHATGFSSTSSLSYDGSGSRASDWSVNSNPSVCPTAAPTTPPVATTTARYRVTFDAFWSSQTHPTAFPSNPHFSGLIGLTHTSNVALFELGGMASPGIVNMAETGSKNPLTSEIEAIINGGQGQTLLSGGGVGTSPGAVTLEFDISDSHPLVSLTTMIAPSPDWFVGVRDLNLFENGQWVDRAITVGVYDGGSDSGTSFTSGNQATNPMEPISMITGGPLATNGSIPSMGTMTFERIDVPNTPVCNVAGGTVLGGPFEFCVDGAADNIPAGSLNLTGNTGANMQWVVTDLEGNILGLPPMPSVVDFDGAGAGVCLVWNLAYEDGLTGLAAGNNVDQLSGCYSLSNSVSVTRNEAVGGSLAGGPFEFCVGDSVADNLAAGSISLSGNSGGNSQWVVTDEQGNILGLPPMPSAVDFDGAGVGTCLVWHLSYADGLTGLAAGNNVSQLSGCYDLSNSVSVNRVDCGAGTAGCAAAGGTLFGGPFEFCVDGAADNIPAGSLNLQGNTGTNLQWVVTDLSGNILGLPPMPSAVDFDGAGAGVCLVWALSYEDGLTGLAAGNNVDQLSGCYSLSNSVSVTRNEAVGGSLAGGPFEFCVGDGVADNLAAGSISLSGNSGSNSQWVVTDEQGNILGLPPMPSAVDFDGAGVGTCLVWHLSYADGLTGLAAGNNVSQLSGCYDLSNSVSVNRVDCGAGTAGCSAVGGSLLGGPFDFCIDGAADNIPAGSLNLVGNAGSNLQWVVTDLRGNILGLPPMPSVVDFDGAGAGVCLVWALSYEDGLTGLAAGNNVDQLAGCYSLSNSVSVTRNEAVGGTLTGGPFNFTVGDGVADNLAPGSITLSGNSGSNSQWVVTDEQGNILGLPPMPSAVNFDGAGAGTCLIWHLSFEDGLQGAEVGMNASDLEGCYSLSNSIAVVRSNASGCNANGGELFGGPFSFTVGDGVADNIAAGSITLANNSGQNSQWVVTDEQGNILGLPPMPSAVNFDGAGAGTCLIWHLSFEDGLQGAEVGMNASDLEGCYSLSNSIAVVRSNASGCNANGGELFGGPFSFTVGDGVADNIAAGSITLANNSGQNSQWVVTDEQGNILGLPPMPSAVNFDGAGAGTCLIWHLSFEDGLQGAEVGMNANDLEGCYSLSNSIAVVRSNASGCNANGGELFGGPFEFCVGDGKADNLTAGSISVANNSGQNSQWVVTDDQGNILGLPPMPSAVDFDGAGVGTCLIWYLSYDDGLTGLAAGNNVDQLSGCYSLSNSVSVNRVDCGSGTDDCTAAGGTLVGGPFEFCVGDGEADNLAAGSITLSGNSGSKSQWVVTDDQGNILGLPPMPSAVDFDGAGAGICLIWHLSYEGEIVGLEAGLNANDLEGCYSLSNAVTVNRSDDGSICHGGSATCAVPSEPEVTNVSSRKIILDWEDVAGARGYIIQVRFKGRENWAATAFVRYSKAKVLAPANRDYEYRLKSVCHGEEESAYSAIFEFSTTGGNLQAASSRNAEVFEADVELEKVFENATIAPNPFSNSLELNYTSTADHARVSIFHVSGRKVLEQVITKDISKHRLDVSDLENGLYMLSVLEDGQQVLNRRIVKQSK